MKMINGTIWLVRSTVGISVQAVGGITTFVGGTIITVGTLITAGGIAIEGLSNFKRRLASTIGFFLRRGRL